MIFSGRRIENFEAAGDSIEQTKCSDASRGYHAV
jgi:hypothetical protein